MLLTQGKIQISRVTDKIYLAHFSICILLSFVCLNKKHSRKEIFLDCYLLEMALKS